ncbi:hypothetical protein KAX02_07695 [candidate division WOR-3 bacterium]|nr:hypothetical protein [candidate division WOR-3 bacterium]
MNILLPIEISLIAGIIFLLLPEKLKGFTKIVAPIIGILNFVLSIIIFFNYSIPLFAHRVVITDLLSRFIFLGIGFFGFIVSVYGAGYVKISKIKHQKSNIENEKFSINNVNKFFAYFFLTLGSAFAIAISNNLIILLIFWGFLGATLYLMIQLGKEGANDAAKKSLIIIGASDCFLIMGIGILWQLTASFNITEISPTTNYSLLSTFSFICFVIASFAKAGNMPFHTWIPPTASTAPIPVTAYLPASLDKLLGIYLLARCVLSIYKLTPGLSAFLMISGALTIIFAVFMAMIQHSGRKLLSYHAVSQVGYMVLGIGTGNPIGIAGGLFHMFNHAIYKSCLFLGLGEVEKNTRTDDLDSLGGLAGKMPLTLFTMLTASLAISGVPPLNGFFSKWMIYQGVINTFNTRNPFIPALCLIAALFGSALTLASFMKLIHSIFLARKQKNKDVEGTIRFKRRWTLIIPQLILAVACIVLGIFAYPVIINPVFRKIVPFTTTGMWKPELSAGLIIIGVILGLLIYGISRIKVRVTPPFIGGEKVTPEMKVSGTDFYLTIKEIGIFSRVYDWAEKMYFDIYEIFKKWIFYFSKIFRYVHTGSLPFYLLWIVIGLVIILIIM